MAVTYDQLLTVTRVGVKALQGDIRRLKEENARLVALVASMGA